MVYIATFFMQSINTYVVLHTVTQSTNRVQSTGGGVGGEASPPNTPAPPQSFPICNLK